MFLALFLLNTLALEIHVLHKPVDCANPVSIGSEIRISHDILVEDEVIDSSSDRFSTFTFTVGDASSTKGMSRGVVGMCTNEIRRIVVPPDEAFGMYGRQIGVPVDADITYRIELVEIIS